jgi:serine/threonine-protein kinase
MANPGSTADENEVPTLPSGTQLGKYSIARLLGSGGMGAVYEATHTEIGKKVAIKVLSPLIAAVPGARARFLREAQLTSRVRHPHIVDVADMGSDGGNTYLVMEFLHGEDLAQRLERLGPVGIEEMADIMLPVCSAVSAAHAAGVTHRDLKPQNIFLASGTRRVHPKVLDFGISKGNDAVTQAGTLTGTGAMIGTPYYLAPEQIMDSKSAGSASDQYALGIILYECLTGRRPYDGDNLFVVFQGIVGGTPKRPRELRPEIPPEMEEVVLRAMKSEAKARFATIDDFGRALLPFASSRARVIWDEAFAGGAGDAAAPPGRPSIAVVPTPAPATRASTLMPPGLANPGGAGSVGPIPGASTLRPPGSVSLSTSQRLAGGAPTPTPAPNKTIALWGQSPLPQPRVPTGAAMPGSPESEAAASVRASMVHSKSHPIVTDDALDAPAPARGKKGIAIAVAAAAVVVVGGVAAFALRGGSGSKAEAPAAAPAAQPAAAAAVVQPPPSQPPPSTQRPEVIPSDFPRDSLLGTRKAKPAPPLKVKPDAQAADQAEKQVEKPVEEPTAGSKHDGKGKDKDKGKAHSHGKAHGGGGGKPAGAKPAAGVPVID